MVSAQTSSQKKTWSITLVEAAREHNLELFLPHMILVTNLRLYRYGLIHKIERLYGYGLVLKGPDKDTAVTLFDKYSDMRLLGEKLFEN